MTGRDGINKYGKKWSENETILAYYYYCQIPFGRIHKANPEIIRIATLLGRTPSSVTLKMGNLGHFDPELKKKNISGLSNASKTDEYVVSAFQNNWEDLTVKAKEIECSLSLETNNGIIDTMIGSIPTGSDREVITKQRVNQQFFRNAVLTSYQNKCCITGIDTASLLIASHIKPWSISDPKTERTNPSNGLCLNVLHDKAFDKGLITVLPDYTIRVSSELKNSLERNESYHWLVSCDKQKIMIPEKFLPGKEFLEYHNDIIFVG